MTKFNVFIANDSSIGDDLLQSTNSIPEKFVFHLEYIARTKGSDPYRSSSLIKIADMRQKYPERYISAFLGGPGKGEWKDLEVKWARIFSLSIYGLQCAGINEVKLCSRFLKIEETELWLSSIINSLGSLLKVKIALSVNVNDIAEKDRVRILKDYILLCHKYGVHRIGFDSAGSKDFSQPAIDLLTPRDWDEVVTYARMKNVITYVSGGMKISDIVRVKNVGLSSIGIGRDLHEQHLGNLVLSNQKLSQLIESVI